MCIHSPLSQAIDCQMNTEMRVTGYDSHEDPVVLFAQQMIPHHVNAVNMAKLTLKDAADEGTSHSLLAIYSRIGRLGEPMSAVMQWPPSKV